MTIEIVEQVRSTFMEVFREFMEQINRKVLARYSDVSEKQFSSLSVNRERIRRYIDEAMT